MSIPKDKPKLIILATDGAPTDEDGRSTIQARQQFIDVLRQRDADMNRIVILLCTDDDAIVKLYEDIDETIDNICVIDDYQTEKAKVEKCQGDGYNYTQDMHRARFILAGINDIFDKMNERKIYTISMDRSFSLKISKDIVTFIITMVRLYTKTKMMNIIYKVKFQNIRNSMITLEIRLIRKMNIILQTLRKDGFNL